ncbi:hypothetical protein E5288_WYG019369 [Bos mutus]|uniref:Uncharacterized protein n=1 Tax=Bos mutus TaxID=72004 RepID=A0A6B0RCB0_9CETA|nr:hypothetical protein [Bos mutus]
MAGNDCGSLLDEELSSFFLNYLADTQGDQNQHLTPGLMSIAQLLIPLGLASTLEEKSRERIQREELRQAVRTDEGFLPGSPSSRVSVLRHPRCKVNFHLDLRFNARLLRELQRVEGLLVTKHGFGGEEKVF